MKYVMFVIGLLLSVTGYVGIDIFGRAMANSEPGYSSTEYALIICFGGVLPLICGIIMCFFAVKKWMRARKHKTDLLKAADAVAAAAAEAASRKTKRNVILLATCFLVPGGFVFFLILDWIGFPWREEWPLTLLFCLCLLFGSLAGACVFLRLKREIDEMFVAKTREGKQ